MMTIKVAMYNSILERKDVQLEFSLVLLVEQGVVESIVEMLGSSGVAVGVSLQPTSSLNPDEDLRRCPPQPFEEQVVDFVD